MKARTVEGIDPSAPLRPNAARIVRTRLDELRSFADTALAPGASTAQHDMRITAKRLRYVLEIVGPCFGEEAKGARDTAKQLQSVLGDLHDCDLMLERVKGIDSAAALLCVRRHRLFRDFDEAWQASSDAWAALELALRPDRG